MRKEIAERVAIDSEGYYGIGYDDLGWIFKSIRQEYDNARKMMEEYLEGGMEEAMREDASLRMLVPLMKLAFEFGDLLKPFGLATTAAVLRYQGREIVHRSIW
jgi:hypothetical protein